MKIHDELGEYVIIHNSIKDMKNLGLLVDGPNMLRKEFCSDLDVVKNLLVDRGNLKIGKVLLNQYASDKLIEAVVNQGFSPMIVAGDVDVQLAVEAFELIHNPNIDVVALMTRNADFLPLINIAKENGKETIVIGAEPGFSVALQNSADDSIILESEGV
ncbi:TIGR00288 family NYN domain-containing protein [Methanothermobacter wolfeii]|uniref:TIGR00288 family NYN domain-containing protein n=1 Tax=Methanothermobacter wolfeii TaxID=145261 RepID=A0A9E7ULD2_METWO|nr:MULTISPECIES: TIGR00288 family NYN domain-containing protein [Methanothermobacter]MDI6702034.1 TIGR00288 family NYN domain-containing protein [Methanothermobacter wolfeii]MDI6842644.1 TIGR00288 family NYN domain-containing protein [Methanothermobacter wolfeii]NLM02109.1 TIGR00288 family NYN domain-containing protein [Methanothermobacter wolfeii]QHN06794.1 TIGR00288 family NYN domain-containing protein [Methanothermobacter sp. THM-1]UXH31340.1 TIGR00288 family NYN domain-containing protein [